jgi:hypothetical protein
MRERVGLITILTIVMQVSIVAGGGDGGTISRHSSERCVEKKTTDK